MKRYLKRSIIAVVLILLVIIVYPPLTFKQLPNANPLPENMVKGVFHIHSVFSDGKGDVEEITGAAAKGHLDFVILTDHGEPNVRSVQAEGWYGDVLLVGGSEFSTDAGHLAAAGFPVKKYRVPTEPQLAIDYVNRHEGFSFVSHPFDKKIPWTDWDIRNFTGLEVLSSYSSARRISIPRLLAFPLRYLLNHKYALLGSLDYPAQNLEVWDSLNREGRHMGIYALDAHARIPLTRKISLNFPAYRAIFSSLNIYVILDTPLPEDPEEASAAIVRSIRKGRFFNVIESIAPANGFGVKYTDPKGTEHFPGDEVTEGGGALQMNLPFRFPVSVTLVRNGDEESRRVYPPGSPAEWMVSEPGVYRFELFIPDSRFNELPWITTNPFFIGRGPVPMRETLPEPESEALFEKGKHFHVEQNPSSSASLEYEDRGEEKPVMRMIYRLKGETGERDYWTAMSARENIDLSEFTGIGFETRSPVEMVYWVEIRTGEEDQEYWYRHAFLSSGDWSTLTIPFGKFRQISGKEKNRKMDTGNIRSLFFSINHSMLTVRELTGTLEIRGIGAVKEPAENGQ